MNTRVVKYLNSLPSFMLSCFLVAFLVLSLSPAPAQALHWNGENGLIRFSFVEGDPTANILHAPTENGVTKLTLVAWLTDVEPVSIDGTPFVGLGGFEMKLKITGAQGFILNQKSVEKGINVSREKGGFVVGMAFGLPLEDGKAPLAQWDIMFQGEVKDVMFSLDPEGLFSCRTSPGCPECEPQAIYIGTDDAHQLQELFSAGYEPAWLNPSGEPDTRPITGKATWQDVGRANKAAE